MMAAPVTAGAKFDSGTPVALFQANPREQVSLNDVFVYDVRPDGQAFSHQHEGQAGRYCTNVRRSELGRSGEQLIIAAGNNWCG